MMELPDRPEWQDRAFCNGTNDPLFFPPDSPVSEDTAAKEAMTIYCGFCPVFVECLNSAIIHGDLGVWAGTTSATRLKLRRKRDRKKCPGCESDGLVNLDDHSVCVHCGLSWTREARVLE